LIFGLTSFRPKGTSTPSERQDAQPTVIDDPAPPPPLNLQTVPADLIDVENDSKAPTPQQNPGAKTPPSTTAVYPGGFSIDVCFEASKLPLDVAIFNSARAAGGDDKIRKYLQAVLVIGGTAHIPGMGHALESRSVLDTLIDLLIEQYFTSSFRRLQAIATPLVQNMEKVQIIPPPKEVDPRVLAWKGAAVLGKMDSVSDLWVTKADWVSQLRPTLSCLTRCSEYFGYAGPEGTVFLPLGTTAVYSR
jgi:actin-related protein 8